MGSGAAQAVESRHSLRAPIPVRAWLVALGGVSHPPVPHDHGRRLEGTGPARRPGRRGLRPGAGTPARRASTPQPRRVNRQSLRSRPRASSRRGSVRATTTATTRASQPPRSLSSDAAALTVVLIVGDRRRFRCQVRPRGSGHVVAVHARGLRRLKLRRRAWVGRDLRGGMSSRRDQSTRSAASAAMRGDRTDRARSQRHAAATRRDHFGVALSPSVQGLA
jgi:hypothetical protein